MCPGCGRIWTALQVLWSTFYIFCGAAQLVSGVFFVISIPANQLSCHIWTGAWNVIAGIVGGMLACFGRLSPRRQEALLYAGASILTVNIINAVLSEWGLYSLADLKDHPNHMLIDYACFATRIATATVIVVSFLDTQFAFCSMQTAPSKINKKRIPGSHEQVSDIEYIIPRAKTAKPQSTILHAYSQSWVFDADHAPSSSAHETHYLKILENGTPTKSPLLQNGDLPDTAHLIDNETPVVHIEEASDDSTSNSDRKLCHMKSFSRSTSPVLLSGASSHASLNHVTNPPIYDCLETIYRSRLNTGGSNPEETQYQAPHVMMTRRTEVGSPHVEKVQYASLMKELQRAIVSKKEPSVSSPLSSSSEKTPSDSKSSSRSDAKNSDAEFSKELEAALQLIQDLESPNTIDTPSEPTTKSDGKEQRPLAVWRSSDHSESDKTLSAVGSMGEITSPLEGPPELYTFKAAANGKGASVIIRYPDSQSTSGYSSPNEPTPCWSTTSSLNGSNTDIVKPLAYSIHNAESSTVISLYSQAAPPHKSKSVTLVNIRGPPQAPPVENQKSSTVWNVKSMLRKKKQAFPKLCPELEGAIIKSESLAYLSELELLARHQRNNEIQREIEERVIQQLGTPRMESNC